MTAERATRIPWPCGDGFRSGRRRQTYVMGDAAEGSNDEWLRVMGRWSSMKRQEQRACAWLVVALVISGCAEAAKPAEQADPEPPAPVRIAPPPDYNITCVALSPDGKTLAYGLSPVTKVAPEVWKPLAGWVILCEASSAKELFKLPGPLSTTACDARFSPDGKRIVVGNCNKSVTLWDVATGKNGGDLEGTVSSGAPRLWTPNGALLAGWAAKLDARETDGNIHLWSAADGKEIRAFGSGGPWGYPRGFAFAADSHSLAVEHWLTDRVHPDQPLEKDYLYRWRGAVDLWDPSAGRRLGVVAGFSAPVEGYHSPPSRLPEVGAVAGAFRPRILPGGRYLLLPTYPDGRPSATSDQVLSVTGGTQRLESQVVPTPVDREAGTLVIREAATGKELRRLADFAEGSVYSTQFFPGGDALVVMGNQKDRSPAFLLVYDVSDLNRAVREARARLTPEQVSPLWDALADADATKAFPALRLLVLNPDRALPILKDHLRPADDRRVPKLVGDLNSDDFETREAASRGLAALGEAARSALEKAAAADPAPEARQRLNDLLEKLNGRTAPEELRGVRAVDVLEQIGTDGARAVLKDLAAGAPGALTTQAAKDALDRLQKTPAP